MVVNDIQFGAENTLLVGTSKGLLQLENGKFNRMPMGKATHEAVKAIAFNQTDGLWIAGTKGVMKYDAVMPYTFSEFEGLPSKIMSYRGLMVDADNQLWVATSLGIAYADSKTTFYPTPAPIITNIETSEQDKLLPSQQVVISEDEFVNISYICPTFPQEGTTFFIKLYSENDTLTKTMEGIDPIFFSHLKSGDYTLELWAKKRGHFQKSSSVKYQFSVYRIWYKTTWGNAIILIISITGGLISINSKRLKQKQLQLEKVISTRTQEIEAQKNQINALLITAQQTNDELRVSEEEIRQ